MTGRGTLLLTTMAWALVLGAAAHADGMKLGPRYVKTLPSIPSQRALIEFRDGEERLTIDSSVEGEGDAFAWIVPVPASPTAFEAVSSGLIESMSYALQPAYIDYEERGRASELRFCSFVVLLWFLFALVSGERWRWLAALTLVLVVVLLIVPALMRTRSAGTRGVEVAAASDEVRVEQTHRIGSYDLAVLDADSPGALTAWLEAHDYMSVPEAGDPIVRDYIASGWRFVAAQLRRDEKEGLSRPHPISMTFPHETPVYPMRLTALSGSPLYLELFVVAERRAAHTDLLLEMADRFHEAKSGVAYMLHGTVVQPPVARGDAYRAQVGHPEAMERLWDGCIVSKLTATLSSEAMAEDFDLTLRGTRPHQQELFSHRGARNRALIWALTLWCVAVPIAVLVLYRVGRGPLRCLLVRLGAGAGVAAACAVVYGVVPGQLTLAGEGAFEHIPPQDLFYPHGGLDEYLRERMAMHRGFRGWTAEQVADFLVRDMALEELRTGWPVTPPPLEAVPGGLTVHASDNGPTVRTYMANGTPWEFAADSGSASPVPAPPTVEEMVGWLRGERLRQGELARIGQARDPRLVEPLIAHLEWHHADPYVGDSGGEDVAETILHRLTGQRIPSWHTERWRAWWAENGDKPRLTWLRDAYVAQPTALVAYELALLGDDRGMGLLSAYKGFPLDNSATGCDWWTRARLATGRAVPMERFVPRAEARWDTPEDYTRGYGGRLGDTPGPLGHFGPKAMENAWEVLGQTPLSPLLVQAVDLHYDQRPGKAAEVFLARLPRDEERRGEGSLDVLFDLLSISRITGLPLPTTPEGRAAFLTKARSWALEHAE